MTEKKTYTLQLSPNSYNNWAGASNGIIRNVVTLLLYTVMLKSQTPPSNWRCKWMNFMKLSLKTPLHSGYRSYGMELEHTTWCCVWRATLPSSQQFCSQQSLLKLHLFLNMLNSTVWSISFCVSCFISVFHTVFVKYIFEATEIMCVKRIFNNLKKILLIVPGIQGMCPLHKFIHILKHQNDHKIKA